MGQFESKSRAAKKPIGTKFCFKCGKTRDMDIFYSNKDWKQELGKDIWCKDCVQKCKTKMQIKEYFWTNNRAWDEKIWELASKKAERAAASNIVYQRASEDMRNSIMQKLTCSNVPVSMTNFYRYEPHNNVDFEEALDKGLIKSESNPDERIYSKEFNGNFTAHDLDFLETYYERLEKEYNFDNESLRDYARKVCKASLQADKAQDAYAAGKIPYQDVKDALNQFDNLSKSANFAACKRKEGDTSGLTSWSETTYQLQTTGHTMQRKVEYEPDTIDMLIKELTHIVTAIGVDS